MVDKVFRQVRARALRATKVDGCGFPVLGPDSVVVSEGFVTATMTANIEAGQAIQVTNAAGKLCINDQPTPKFSNYSGQIVFCGTDPALLSLLTGQPVVLDADDNVVGFRQNTKVDVDAIGLALELWTAITGNVCEDPSAAGSFGYSLFPFLKGGVIGDVTYQNGAIDFTVTNLATRDGSGWGVGPWDVTLDETGNPGPLLEPIDSGDHLHVELVSVAPPSTETEGYQALGTLASGATAGTPGAWTPPNSYGPETLAELTASGITASPATAWTTGQSVVLRDGSRAHWSGSAWAAGVA